VWVEARHTPLDLLDSDGAARPIAELAGKRVVAFCGIGNPEGFRRTLEGIGVAPVAFVVFPDHHAYDRRNIEDLTGLAAREQADLVLTTQKDLVKVRWNEASSEAAP
jgi:tetraacyldisaccharide 4'-kinase